MFVDNDCSANKRHLKTRRVRRELSVQNSRPIYGGTRTRGGVPDQGRVETFLFLNSTIFPIAYSMASVHYKDIIAVSISDFGSKCRRRSVFV